MVIRSAIHIKSQKYQLIKVVHDYYYESVEPTSPTLTDVHHDICGRTSGSQNLMMTSNRSLAGTPVQVATITHTKD
jgi:hypothetical protein